MDRQPPSVELYVQSLTPSGATHRLESILDHLDRLDRRGDIAGYDVTVWGEKVVPDSLAARTDFGREVLETVDEFESWASAYGVSVERFYPTETVDSALTGEEFTTVSLPVMAMAEYVDGRLQHVTPHEGDGIQTVSDRLDALADRDTSGHDRERGDAPTVPAADDD